MTRHTRPMVLALAALAGLRLGGAAVAAVPGYTATELGSLGGGYTRVFGVNNRGQAVGESSTAAGFGHAVLWQNGVVVDLGTLGGRTSIAEGINDAGQVVGVSTLRSGSALHAFLWDSTGGMVDLGTLRGNDNDIEAYGINNQGQVVGLAYLAGGSAFPHAFLWDPVSGMRDLGINRVSRVSGFRDLGINGVGQVVGSEASTDVPYASATSAWMWDPGVAGAGGTAAPVDLGTLGGTVTVARGLNDFGQAVGLSDLGNQPWHAFLWQEGTMSDLGTAGGEASFANELNDSGQAAGYANFATSTFAGPVPVGADPHYNGVLWSDGAAINLGDFTPGTLIYEAVDINQAGQIAANGARGGKYVPILLSPPVTAEPAFASPKPALDCSVTPLQTLPFQTVTQPQIGGDTAPITGGAFKGQSLTIVGANQLTSNLTVVADGDLVVSGQITVGTPAAGQPSPNITLVSTNGTVRIALGAVVGGGSAGDGAGSTVTAADAKAVAVAGQNGGAVTIIGRSVVVDGMVVGLNGGNGGSASAMGQRAAAGAGFSGGRARAWSGAGGFGGDILFCASESITVSATGQVAGSQGGSGGAAVAQADNGRDALAYGGAASAAGEITFRGSGGTPCAVVIDGGSVIAGTLLTQGGDATATAGDGLAGGRGQGGNAYAEGGPGGAGGSARFTNCKLTLQNGGSLTPGDGGVAGQAQASGGTSAAASQSQGLNGGIAVAQGGRGGKPGGINDSITTSAAGQPGPGGNASAIQGGGGDGLATGGATGVARARGGSNGFGEPAELQEMLRTKSSGAAKGAKGAGVQSVGAQ